MKYSRIEGIEKDWSRITLGCWQIAPSAGWGDSCPEKDAEKVVRVALDQGITAFDTAEGYGDGESERRLGKALGSQKDSAIIISKIWPEADQTLKDYQKALDNSLRALGRDYVDLYLMHCGREIILTVLKKATSSPSICWLSSQAEKHLQSAFQILEQLNHQRILPQRSSVQFARSWL